jgi:hypothetical protein
MCLIVLLILLLDPLLVYEKAEMGEDGFEGALDLFPETFDPKRIQPEFSGKSDTTSIYLAILLVICTCVCVGSGSCMYIW